MGLLSSKSSSKNTTNNTDARVVGGDDSLNTSLHVSGTRNLVTTTDHGAVSGSLTLALRGVEGAQSLAREAQAAQGSLLEGALKMSGAQNEHFASTIEKIKTSDVRTLVIAGLAVVGLAAAMYFRRA